MKYRRYIVDKYFGDPGIDEVNKLLFAFAACNAGANRIARLKKPAPEYEIDPNQPFRNVEYIVERKVGREPVRYAGNIYRHYVARRRVREMEEQGQKPVASGG